MAAPRLEAVFVAADDPRRTAAFLRRAVGTGAGEAGPDGQQLLPGLGTFVALEPTPAGAAPGDVTLWLRVDDVATTHRAAVAAGAVSVEEPAGDVEVTALLRTPDGLRLGLIGAPVG